MTIMLTNHTHVKRAHAKTNAATQRENLKPLMALAVPIAKRFCEKPLYFYMKKHCLAYYYRPYV